eukprot:11547458-Ditylum_brightwellii.AAC.1
MSCNRSNTCCTNKQQKEDEQKDTKDFFLNQEPQKIHAVSLVLKLVDEFKNTLYSDLTGKFPATAQLGNKYVLVANEYDSNAILAIPVPNHSDPTIIKALIYI